jgi:hypothetical protein
MGNLERESRKRKRKRDLQRVILGSVALAGALSVAALAPNALGAMHRLGMLPNKREGEILKRSRERLIKQGSLAYHNGFLRLTKKGERELRFLELKEFGLEKPRRWDGKWRILVFDIPERRRKVRTRIRRVLMQIGFVRLQDSVWVYPYDCEDVITLFKADVRLGKDLLYLIVDMLEHEAPYRRHFGLGKK